MSIQPTQDGHFKAIYKFIFVVVVFGMLLTLLTIFVPIPKENQRFADTGLIFWLSTAVSGGIGYLIGNSANTGKKKEDNLDGVPIKDGDTITIEK